MFFLSEMSQNTSTSCTILIDMMVDEFNIVWSKIQDYIAEADAELIPVTGRLELHGRCRCGVLLSPCFGALFVADLMFGDGGMRITLQMRGRCNFRKIRVATISVRMVFGQNQYRAKSPISISYYYTN